VHRLGAPPRLLITLGGVIVIGASFLPWVTSGSVDRSSYRVIGLVDRLGYASDGPMELALRAWPVLPLAVTVAVVAAWWNRPAISALVGATSALYAAAVALATLRAPTAGLVTVQAGPTIALAGTAVMLLAVAWLALDLRWAPASGDGAA
jgi:hypothetical protein